MLNDLTDRVADKAAQTAQTAAIGLGASLCLVVGFVFLIGAAWLFLLTVTTALIACLIIGGLFTGTGLIMIAMMSARSKALKRKKQQEALRFQARQKENLSSGLDGMAGIIAAFINGMNAGKKARY